MINLLIPGGPQGTSHRRPAGGPHEHDRLGPQQLRDPDLGRHRQADQPGPRTMPRRCRIGRISAGVIMVLAMLWSTQGGQFGTIFEAINKIPMIFAPAVTTVLVLGVFWKRGNNTGRADDLRDRLRRGTGLFHHGHEERRRAVPRQAVPTASAGLVTDPRAGPRNALHARRADPLRALHRDLHRGQSDRHRRRRRATRKRLLGQPAEGRDARPDHRRRATRGCSRCCSSL